MKKGQMKSTVVIVSMTALACGVAQGGVTDISGNLALPLDTVVGAGNSARLIGNTRTIWNATISQSDVDLNNFEFYIHNGDGNNHTYNGAISGPGFIKTAGKPDATTNPDIRLGGTAANTPTGVTIEKGRITLNKTSGVDALAGAITVSGSSDKKRIVLEKNHQINDASTIVSTAGAGSFVLDLNGFSETIATLSIKSGDAVNTGLGGVLNVSSLTVGGVNMPKGAYTASSGFVEGTGYIDVDNFGPPVILDPPSAPTTPSPTNHADTVHPTQMKKLDWADSTDTSSYDVYLWLTSEAQPISPSANVIPSEYNLPADLESLTNYNWRVVASNSVGVTTGEVWSFSTVASWLISGNLPASLDAVVGAGHNALLVGNTKTFWHPTTSSLDINLNGFEFNIDNGSGNAQIYNGAIIGPGTLKTVGRPDSSFSPDIRLGGSEANTPESVLVFRGRLTLNKDEGVDALAGPITIGNGGSVQCITLEKSHQINDLSTIDATGCSNMFKLELKGFNETIASLSMNANHRVSTGTAGVLTVAALTIDGVSYPKGIYESSHDFIEGGGSVVVTGFFSDATVIMIQ